MATLLMLGGIIIGLVLGTIIFTWVRYPIKFLLLFILDKAGNTLEIYFNCYKRWRVYWNEKSDKIW